MVNFLQKIIRRLKRLKPHISEQWRRSSYSQEGEDLVLDRMLAGKKNGFYVDVGSHHPFRFSNTYLFYRRGWSGICIDPLPGTTQLFAKHRPRDIVVEMGVSEVESQLIYYMFNEPALNTCDSARAKKLDGLGNYKVIDKINIKTEPLSKILERYIKSDTQIDILNVDVEGLDLQVLKSNDWGLFKPKYIIAECFDTDIAQILDDHVVRYLCKLNYTVHAITGRSIIFTVFR